MRELTMDELGEVSGGDFTETLQYLGTAAALAQITYGTGWGSMGVVAAFSLSPLGGAVVLGLAFTGGYVIFSD